MSDDPKQPPIREPELELARPVRSPSNPPARSSPSVSNPNLQGVRSAARAQPLPAAPAPKKAAREKLKEGAADTILNSVSILGDVLEDFRTSDKFFKYKAMVLTLWFALTVGAFGVACPTNDGPSNEIEARLVVGDGSPPVYMVKNESADAWENVEIVVNGGYRSTMATMEANGGNVTLSPAVLFDANGKRAPSTLAITDITVQVGDPEATVVLLKGGEIQR
ncbi:MAG: hypothetical protein IT380_22115 [Myxococcales bacterium]|nr:hypothetical protein [Myxococcales bacterium]